MTLKTTLAALALALSPTLALADGCNWGTKVQSCGDGQVYDTATGTCVSKATS